MTPRSSAFGTIVAAIVAAALSLVVFALPTRAAVTPASTRTMQVTIATGKSQVLGTGRAYAQALIGNPDVADVLPMTGAQVYVLGKKPGATNLTLYDRNHALIAVIDINVGPDADGYARQIAAIMPRERIGVRATNDSLILDGTLSSSVAALRAVQVAETFAPGKVINLMTIGTRQQVLLEVKFSEIKRSAVEQLGLRSTVTGKNVEARVTGPFAAAQTIFGAFGIGGLDFNVRLDALETKGLATTLAEPNLVALSGETASFLSGGEFPIPVVSGGGSGTAGGAAAITIEFKQFGVSLAFTPTVLEDGIISLPVAAEVSAINQAASITLNSIVIPGLATRRTKTTVELRDGQSFAIAGLIQSEFSDTLSQIPLLGRIPILGALFRSTSFQRNESELVIVVTPHIVGPAPGGSIRVPTDRVTAPENVDLILRGSSESRRALPALPPELPR